MRPRWLPRLAGESGFTMIVVMLVMLVTSLILVVVFTAASGDTHNSRAALSQKQAYAAAIAGVEEYEYKLEAEPDYWEGCPKLESSLPGEAGESYTVTTLVASSDPEGGTCSPAAPPANPFSVVIEAKGNIQNTFRIESVGKATPVGKAAAETSRVIATFAVAGFLNYIYFTQFEDQDPASRAGSHQEQVECENYRPTRERLGILNKCGIIEFGPEDKERGPVHTDDEAEACEGSEFGRSGQEPPDVVEFNYGVTGGCGGSATGIYHTQTGEPSKGPELVAPESDTSLLAYVEHEPQDNEFQGRTELALEGSTIKVTTVRSGVPKTQSIAWPANGLIFISKYGECGYNTFNQKQTDTTKTYAEEEKCGSVYVHGTYSKSLTIGAETDLIVNGSITPTGVTPPAAPSGGTTLGLIASRFVRIYHPCASGSNETGSLTSPWIYAAILSTNHSFVVDNYECGAQLGNLGVYGAIGQKFRGIVGTVNTHGYNKEYLYDERLATDEPPYFIAPLRAGWRIARLTGTG